MDYFQLLEPENEAEIENFGSVNRAWLFKSELRIELDKLIDRISEVDMLTIGEMLRGRGIEVENDGVSKYLKDPLLDNDMLHYIKSLLAYGFGIF